MKRNPFVCMLLLLCAPQIFASEYITRDSAQIYYGETESLRNNGGVVRAWVQWIPVFKDYVQPSQSTPPTIDDIRPESKIQSVLYSFKCSELMIGTLQWVRYSDLERQVAVDTWADPHPEKLRYTYVVPDSVGEGLLQWACKGS